MTSHDPMKPICGVNLSDAWAQAFVQCHGTLGGVIAPGIVRFGVEDPPWEVETAKIRQLLETHLGGVGSPPVIQSPIDTVAGTIFPQSVWMRCRGNRGMLFERYAKMWPRIKKCRQNLRGLYFRRLTAFDDDEANGNQLEHIITTWHSGNHRHSALQAGVFDPRKDHTHSPRQVFPCLQQVVFRPNGTNGKDGMTVVAFYATQLLMEKAYGNYLGLYRLGRFMAEQMGLKLKDVICIASDLKLNRERVKGVCEPLVCALNKELMDAEEQ